MENEEVDVSLSGFGGIQLLYVPLVPLALAAEALQRRKQERSTKKIQQKDPKYSLDKALLKDSKNHRLFFQRALLSAAKEDWKSAISDLTLSLELQPNDYQVLYMRACIEDQLGHYLNAEKDLVLALESIKKQTLEKSKFHHWELTPFIRSVPCVQCKILVGFFRQGIKSLLFTLEAYCCTICGKFIHYKCVQNYGGVCEHVKSENKNSSHKFVTRNFHRPHYCIVCKQIMLKQGKECFLCGKRSHVHCQYVEGCGGSSTQSFITISDIQNQLGLVYFHQGKYKVSIEYFDLAIQSAQESSASIAGFIGNRGLAWFYMENYKTAIEDLTRAIDYHTESARFPQWYAMRGNAKGMLGDHEGAMADKLQAKWMDPSYSRVFPFPLISDLVIHVFSFLHINDLNNAALCCKRWKSLVDVFRSQQNKKKGPPSKPPIVVTSLSDIDVQF